MDLRRRWIRRFGAFSIATWILLGLIHTTVVLARPVTGWRLLREPGADRAIGVPRVDEDGSRLVTQSLGLLEQHTPAESTVWILQSEGYHQDTWWYVQMQLAHLRYPQHFYLMTADSAAANPVRADYVLSLDRNPETSDWSPLAETPFARLFERRP